MKKNLLVIILGLVTLCSYGQIPNVSFETWNSGMPEGYLTTNLYNFLNNIPITNVTQTSDKNTGTSAIKLETVVYKNPFNQKTDTLVGKALTATVVGSTIKPGFPFTSRPSVFSGFYKGTFPKSDTAIIVLGLFKYNSKTSKRDSIGGAYFIATSSLATYTPFSVPFKYLATIASPDSAIIYISASGKNKVPGSIFFIDDLSVTIPTSTSKGTITNFTSAFPNPAKEQLFLNDIPVSASTIEVRNVIGETVFQTEAKENLEINLEKFPSGIYHYAIKNSNNILLYSEKFIVVK